MGRSSQTAREILSAWLAEQTGGDIYARDLLKMHARTTVTSATARKAGRLKMIGMPPRCGALVMALAR